ncbi:hypothetical protein TWF706_003371 [Orbilia oligospora]|nr:hypothetical protein TWF706_003371 [Orbilia oligospora]
MTHTMFPKPIYGQTPFGSLLYYVPLSFHSHLTYLIHSKDLINRLAGNRKGRDYSLTEGQTGEQEDRGTFETYEHGPGAALTGVPALNYVEGLIPGLASSNLSCHDTEPAHRRTRKKPKPQRPQKIYHCEDRGCRSEFLSKKAFGDHMSKVHNRKAFSCDRCPARYSRADALKKHVCKQTSILQGSKQSLPFSSTPSASTSSVSLLPPPSKRIKGPRVSINDLPSSSKSQPPRAAKHIQSSTSAQEHPAMAPYRRSPRRDGPAPRQAALRNEQTLSGVHDWEGPFQERIAQLQREIEQHQREIEQQSQEYDALKEQKRQEEKKRREAEKKCRKMEDMVFQLEREIARSNPQRHGRHMP